ncbi:hypothetical protein IAD21_02828 [Abditibacteriota bacterium]|nr:hypothetical protein IAD21_02828 [Abditibacteriota bacterium]
MPIALILSLRQISGATLSRKDTLCTEHLTSQNDWQEVVLAIFTGHYD